MPAQPVQRVDGLQIRLCKTGESKNEDRWCICDARDRARATAPSKEEAIEKARKLSKVWKLTKKGSKLADEKDIKVDNNLQGNLGDSPDVELPNEEGGPEEKAPANELRDWEKAQQDSNITEVKGPENAVDKTMDLLAEKGSESGGGKKAASVPDRIKVGGFVYKKVTPPAKFIQFKGALYELDED